MANILKFREQLKLMYGKYSLYIDGVSRFLFAMVVFMAVILNTGYNTAISNPFFAIILAFFCAFLPVTFVTPVVCVILLLEFSAISLEPAIVLGIVFLIILLIYFVFRLENSWIAAAVLFFCCCNLHGMIIPLGLLIGPLDIIVVVFGISIYGFILVLKRDTSVFLSTTGNLGTAGKINYFINALLNSPKFQLVLLSVVAGVILVIFVRRRSFRYSEAVGAFLGSLFFTITFLIGNSLLSAGFDYVPAVISCILGGAVSAVFVNFIVSVNYRRTEYVQFEDDDYYYYVKAVPKNTVSVTNVEVVNISAESEGEKIPVKAAAEKSLKGEDDQ